MNKVKKELLFLLSKYNIKEDIVVVDILLDNKDKIIELLNKVK